MAKPQSHMEKITYIIYDGKHLLSWNRHIVVALLSKFSFTQENVSLIYCECLSLWFGVGFYTTWAMGFFWSILAVQHVKTSLKTQVLIVWTAWVESVRSRPWTFPTWPQSFYYFYCSISQMGKQGNSDATLVASAWIQNVMEFKQLTGLKLFLCLKSDNSFNQSN